MSDSVWLFPTKYKTRLVVLPHKTILDMQREDFVKNVNDKLVEVVENARQKGTRRKVHQIFDAFKKVQFE